MSNDYGTTSLRRGHSCSIANRWQREKKDAFDAGRQDSKFNPGDLVLVYRPVRKKGLAEKLLYRWLGHTAS